MKIEHTKTVEAEIKAAYARTESPRLRTGSRCRLPNGPLMAQPKTGYIFSLVLYDVGLMLVAEICRYLAKAHGITPYESRWHRRPGEEITTDIGDGKSDKEESDIPCAVWRQNT